MPQTITAPHVSGVEFQFTDGAKIDRKTGKRVMPVKVKESPSSNGMTRYLTTLWEDGVITCDCAGWCIRKKNSNVRTCKHCKASIEVDCRDMEDINSFMPSITSPAKRRQVILPSENIRVSKHRKL